MNYALSAVLFAVSIPVFLIVGCWLVDQAVRVVAVFWQSAGIVERPVVRWDDEVRS